MTRPPFLADIISLSQNWRKIGKSSKNKTKQKYHKLIQSSYNKRTHAQEIQLSLQASPMFYWEKTERDFPQIWNLTKYLFPKKKIQIHIFSLTFVYMNSEQLKPRSYLSGVYFHFPCLSRIFSPTKRCLHDKKLNKFASRRPKIQKQKYLKIQHTFDYQKPKSASLRPPENKKLRNW